MKNSLALRDDTTRIMGTARVTQRGRPAALAKAFFVAACALGGFHIYSLAIEPSFRVLGAALISFAALLPSYLWCRGRVSGLPIFPLFALSFILKFGYPLAGDDPMISAYDDIAGLDASLLVSAFLLTGTLASYWCQKWVPIAHGPIRTMAPGKGDTFYTALIFSAAVFVLNMVGQWFDIDPGIFSIVRAALTGLAWVGIFVLMYRLGAGELDPAKKALFGFSFLLYLVAYSMSLYLIEVIAALTFAAAAYVIGGGRVPWKWALIMVAVLAVLHAGKDSMRGEYWWESDFKPVQLYDYPAFLSEWLSRGWGVLNSPRVEDDGGMSFSERMSLVPLLLKVQAETPDKRPFLYGETYAAIPALLVPRVLYPDKPIAHQGSHTLSVYYGLQSEEGTQTTTIGWGMLIEAYANFGTMGVIVLAMLIGGLYGGIAKMASGVPILSLRMVIAIVFLAVALQLDAPAGVYLTALFQAVLVVWAMSFIVMERRPSW